MWKYVLKRIGLAFLTAFIILSLTFVCTQLLEFEKPLAFSDDERYGYYEKQVQLGYLMDFDEEHPEYGKYIYRHKHEDKGKISYEYYYRTPVFKQYFSWIKNIVTEWDWGVSIEVSPGLSATTIIGKRIPVSMSLNIISTLLSVPLGILLGIVAALKKNSAVDNIISTSVMILISVPSFVLITLLIYVFCYIDPLNPLLPSMWPLSTDPDHWKVLGYIIPVIALSLGSIAGYCRFVRAELCEVMSSEYLLLARTKGLTKRQAILRHALRNAMVPIVPAILAEFLSIMGGSMILENLYGIPGIGTLFVEALNGKDYSVLFVDMAIFTTFGLLAGVLLDISYGFIDPRIRMGAKK
jgi:oligopeptide transport system permease protein